MGRIYGLPKTHKLNVESNIVDKNKKLKLRPIISSIDTYNYNLAKYLCNKLSPLIPTDFCTKDTFTFLDSIKGCEANIIICYVSGVRPEK